MNDKRRFLLGIVLIVLGAIFLLDSSGAIELRPFMRTWWPALLVLWGVFLIMRRASASATGGAQEAGQPAMDTQEPHSPAERIEQSNVFGNVEVSLASQNFSGGTVSTVFGDCRIDLTKAQLAEGEHTLAVSGVFGKILLTLPPGMAYALSANSFMGSVRAQGREQSGFAPAVVLESPGFSGGGKRLRLRLSQVFGEIELRP
jgi:predicted membrane protein